VHGDWRSCDDESNDIYRDKQACVVDDDGGFIIILPHVLIQGTRLAACQDCERKAYLMDVVPSGRQTVPMLTGTLVHDMIERVIDGLAADDLEELLDKLLDTHRYEIFLAGETIHTMKKTVMPYLPQLERIARVRPGPVGFNYEPPAVTRAIEALPPYGLECLGHEENVWSFQWGLKGVIDLTLRDGDRRFPVELKSGSCQTSPYASHVLQLSAYIFMLKEKYGTARVRSGALFYAKNSVSFRIEPGRMELTHIIIKRNLLAHAVAHGTVPDTASRPDPCRFCDGMAACAFLGTAAQPKSQISRDIEKTLCFAPDKHHHEFYRRWENSLLDELGKARSIQTAIWSAPVQSRVRAGRAIADMTVASVVEGSRTTEFRVAPEAMARSSIAVATRVMLTRGGVPPIVGRGKVVAVEDGFLRVEMTESDLREGEKDVCADLWEATGTIDTCRSNLMSLFAGNGPRLRELVVDMARPRFNPLPPSAEIPGLNEDQQLAVRTARAAQDYMLLLGMPGTGKTTTVATMIKEIAAEGERVLIASYTHTAVDNLCLKLKQMDVDFIRVGNMESIHRDIRGHSLDSVVERTQSLDEIKAAVDSCNVFAATCLGFKNPLIIARTWDLCVVDEASQISVPTVLGPLSTARRFILVGDHYQLSPITDSPSLFRILSEAHPHALVTLRTQYRMNREIMRLCNGLIYGSRMRCGKTDVAAGRIALSRPEVAGEFDMFHRRWMKAALDAEPAVVMYDTDEVPLYERNGQGSKVNYGEAAIVSALAVALVLCGAQPADIGIISPYRAQVMYIRDAIAKWLRTTARFYGHFVNDPNCVAEQIEVHTVDKFQGRDKQCILFSAVKSNPRRKPGNHVTDWQRLNVAITRAMRKFILVGSMTTLRNAQFFDEMFKILGSENVVKLPNEIDQATLVPFVAMPQIASPHGE
jgi:DNA replication ATP-dependent helicase Dna2